MPGWLAALVPIVALRNEKGSYSSNLCNQNPPCIVALRNEKGSYSTRRRRLDFGRIVALRNEKGSYSSYRPVWLSD